MNFLAHAFLAGPVRAHRIGGLMGDFVKGLLPAGLPPDLASGVALHRAIDRYAEQHPAFIASRARISPERRRVGGVLVDLFYDHLLARDWELHARGKLTDFTRELYAEFDEFSQWFSAPARDVAVRMQVHDWLGSYGDASVLCEVIDRMSRYRLRRPNTLGGGIVEFLSAAEGFERDFRQFLPDALAFATAWRAEHGR